MTLQSHADLAEMTALGRLVGRALERLRLATRPGVTTAELDAVGAEFLVREGCRSAPQVFYGFPGFNCISVNDEIVHGVPGPRVLAPGDVVKLDVTAERGGYVADAAVTVVLDPAPEPARALAECARAAFDLGLDVARAGRRVSDLGRVVEAEVNRRGFAVLRELSGHGVGRAIHESPTVPNFFDPRAAETLEEGMVIAFEPIVSAARATPVHAQDGWTIRTSNRSLAAHHEHTIVIREGRPLVLTLAA
jgi:methionyl aminopeptidase